MNYLRSTITRFPRASFDILNDILLFTPLRRHFAVQIGDKVPVSYIKDAPVPVIKADSEYPDWLFTLTDKLPSKNALLSKIEKSGVESLTDKEIMRTKRLITLETIKSNNLQAETGGA